MVQTRSQTRAQQQRNARANFDNQTSVSRAPVARARNMRNTNPVSEEIRGGKRIRHKELIGSVTGETAFTNSKYSINPGDSTTFPYLSLEARRYEQYRFRKLHFHYLTRTGTSTVGSVVMAPDYNAGDTAPASEAQITAYQDAVEVVPWADATCRLDPQAMHALGPRKFIREGNVCGDIRNFDVAKLHLAVLEFSGSVSAGKLWVEYDVELFVPAISTAAPNPQGVLQIGLSGDQGFATGVAEDLDFDTVVYNTIGATISNGQITLPRGAYQLSFEAGFKDTSAEQFAVSAYVYKNGSGLSPSASSQAQVQSAAANCVQQVSGSTYITSDGDDYFTIPVTLTGAAGTLTAKGDETRLFIKCA